MFLITTSHRPSQRTRSFVKDLSQILPFSTTITRGKKTIEELVLEAYRRGHRYIMIVCEKRGNPSLIRIYQVDTTRPVPGPQQYASLILAGITLSRENPDAIRTYGAEKVYVDTNRCSSDRCFRIADLLLEAYKEHHSEKADIIYRLLDKGSITVLQAVNRIGRYTGPTIRIKGIKLYD